MAIRVVVADDNKILRMCVRELLVRMAVDVVEAGSGRELTDILDGGERFDAVVTDVRMSDIGGVDVLKRRRASGDTTAFVVMTGAGGDAVTDARRQTDTVVLLKPFSRDQLREALLSLGVALDGD